MINARISHAPFKRSLKTLPQETAVPQLFFCIHGRFMVWAGMGLEWDMRTVRTWSFPTFSNTSFDSIFFWHLLYSLPGVQTFYYKCFFICFFLMFLTLCFVFAAGVEQKSSELADLLKCAQPAVTKHEHAERVERVADIWKPLGKQIRYALLCIVLYILLYQIVSIQFIWSHLYKFFIFCLCYRNSCQYMRSYMYVASCFWTGIVVFSTSSTFRPGSWQTNTRLIWSALWKRCRVQKREREIYI